MNDPTSSLAEAVAACLIWWPIGFSAVKGTFKLSYSWKPFLLGYLVAVVATAVTTSLLDEKAGGENDLLIRSLIVPLIASVVVGLAVTPLLRRAAKAVLVKPVHVECRKPMMHLTLKEAILAASRLGPIRQARSVMNAGFRRLLSAPGAWTGGMACVLVVLIISFPPWVQHLGNTGLERNLGLGTFLDPPGEAPYGGQYAHIDYGRVALEIILMIAATGIVWLTLRALRTRAGHAAPPSTISGGSPRFWALR